MHPNGRNRKSTWPERKGWRISKVFKIVLIFEAIDKLHLMIFAAASV